MRWPTNRDGRDYVEMGRDQEVGQQIRALMTAIGELRDHLQVAGLLLGEYLPEIEPDEAGRRARAGEAVADRLTALEARVEGIDERIDAVMAEFDERTS